MQEVVSTAVENVQRGADWLDGKYPDWYMWVNVETLDIDSGVTCVSAQLTRYYFNFGDHWDRAIEELSGEDNWDERRIRWQHGFLSTEMDFNVSEDEEVEYSNELNIQWRYEIEKRRREHANEESKKRHPSTGIYSKDVE